jgi:hypothetical protein
MLLVKLRKLFFKPSEGQLVLESLPKGGSYVDMDCCIYVLRGFVRES